MTYYIPEIQSVSPDAPRGLQRLSGNMDNPIALVGALASIGLDVPAGMTIAASTGKPLRTTGHQYSVCEVDAALRNTGLSVAERMRLKAAMGRAGLLPF